MENNKFLFTSESVSEGHPDKVCDRISDMVVDSYLSKDPVSRVACETLTTTNKVILAGETRGPKINKDELITKVRDCIKDIGYDQDGFSWKTANIETFYMNNRLILQWELIPKTIKMKEQAIKE
jgi:S-adenosylmethionine synthetase